MEPKCFLRLSCRGPLIPIQLWNFPHFRFRNYLHFPNTGRTSRNAPDFPYVITGVMRDTRYMWLAWAVGLPTFACMSSGSINCEGRRGVSAIENPVPKC